MAIYLVSTNDGKFLRKIINGETTTKFEELHILKPEFLGLQMVKK